MNAHVVEVFYRHFSRFGYGIESWDSLSENAKERWRRHAIRFFDEVAHSDLPAVEVFYQEFKGKGKPPNNFKDANEQLQKKWRDRVSKFLKDLVSEGMPD